jgi:hypothetical protein
MTWEAYCRHEAVECERLALEVEGEARTAWLEVARAWWAKCTSPERRSQAAENGSQDSSR